MTVADLPLLEQVLHILARIGGDARLRQPFVDEALVELGGVDRRLAVEARLAVLHDLAAVRPEAVVK